MGTFGPGAIGAPPYSGRPLTAADIDAAGGDPLARAAVAALSDALGLTALTAQKIIDALGYTPASISDAAITAQKIAAALGYTPASTATTQPLDSDLTAIAALSTTSFGRDFLALADAVGARAKIGLGSAAVLNTGTAQGSVPLVGAGGKIDPSLVFDSATALARQAPGDGATDATTALQAAITAGDCTIPAQTYVIKSTLTMPIGRRVYLSPGVKFIWQGAYDANGLQAFFTATGQNELHCIGGWADFTAATDKSRLVAIRAQSVNGLDVSGIRTTNCNAYHVACVTDVYADVVTDAMVAAGDSRTVNVSKNVHVRRVRVKLNDSRQISDLAAIMLRYTFNATVEDVMVENSFCPVQWWGGDAGFGNGQQGSNVNAERKCGNIEIRNVRSYKTSAGVWGSFGKNIDAYGCVTKGCLDVGFDSEGGQNITFHGGVVEDCVNGALATFGYNTAVEFKGVRVIQSNKDWPLHRVYNSSQDSNNRDVTLRECYLECTDPNGWGVCDTANGPARNLSMIGCILVNVWVNYTFNNLKNTIVRGCQFLATRRTGAGPYFVAIDKGHVVGGSQSISEVRDNTMMTEVTLPTAFEAVWASGDDPNLPSLVRVLRNQILIPRDSGFAGIVTRNASGNGGTPARFEVYGNRMEGAIRRINAGVAAPYVQASDNTRQDGSQIAPTDG